jgi:hypothetical protein
MATPRAIRLTNEKRLNGVIKLYLPLTNAPGGVLKPAFDDGGYRARDESRREQV